MKEREKAAPCKYQFRDLKAVAASFFSLNASTTQGLLNKLAYALLKTVIYESNLFGFTVIFLLSPISGFSLNLTFIAILTQPPYPFSLP